LANFLKKFAGTRYLKQLDIAKGHAVEHLHGTTILTIKSSPNLVYMPHLGKYVLRHEWNNERVVENLDNLRKFFVLLYEDGPLLGDEKKTYGSLTASQLISLIERNSEELHDKIIKDIRSNLNIKQAIKTELIRKMQDNQKELAKSSDLVRLTRWNSVRDTEIQELNARPVTEEIARHGGWPANTNTRPNNNNGDPD
jgi:RNA-binding protein YhbY